MTVTAQNTTKCSGNGNMVRRSQANNETLSVTQLFAVVTNNVINRISEIRL